MNADSTDCPPGIYADIWRAATEIGELIPSGPGPAFTTTVGDVAWALMRERERCKRLAHQEAKRHGEGPEAVVGLEIALAIVEGKQPE